GDYATTAADSICLIAQVESKAGVDNAAGIANTDGIDAIFVGPNDLSTSMGHLGEIGHPDVQSAIKHVLKVTHAAGKPAGIIALDGAEIAHYSKAGFDFIATGIDTVLLRQAALADTAGKLG